MERAERLLDLGEPKPPSRFRVVYLGSLTALSLWLILWPLASGGGWPRDTVLLMLGTLFLSLWVLADVGGTLVYTRLGATTGRGLRVPGYACLLPLAMCFWLAYFWSVSTWLFVVQTLFAGSIVLRVVVRVARGAPNNG